MRTRNRRFMLRPLAAACLVVLCLSAAARPADARSAGAVRWGPLYGRYDLAIRLSDVALPPASQADGFVHVSVTNAPTVRQIRAVMAHTVEVADRSTHFVPSSPRLTIKDGRGTGYLTAVVGTRYPTADAAGQLTFFWHNKRFLGWDARYETAHILRLKSPGAGAFTITYAHYAAHDPLCCPTLHPVTVHSGWSGSMLISDAVPPKGPGSGVRVMLLK